MEEKQLKYYRFPPHESGRQLYVAYLSEFKWYWFDKETGIPTVDYIENVPHKTKYPPDEFHRFERLQEISLSDLEVEFL